MEPRPRISIMFQMNRVVDLHCHSRHSDGTLSVGDLIALAKSRGVSLISLTDHDEVAGITEAREKTAAVNLAFVPGVEISSEWRDMSIHILGLRIDENEPKLTTLLANIRKTRNARAQRMGDAFAAMGLPGVLAGAAAYAQNPELISRTHFARHLVDTGVCGSMGEVFSRYMKPGKPGYVAQQWVPMQAAIDSIHAAGGRAVLAHPARYETQFLGGPSMLLKCFADAGGDGVEVVCASHNPPEWAQYAALARRFNLLASIGSDFHSPMESRVKFGDLPRLSPNLKPVWHDWPEAECLYA